MSKLWLILCSMLIGGELTAGPENLDELLNWVRQERVREKQDHLKREQRFLEAHNRQQELLHTARQELAAEQARRETIQQTHKSNAKALEDRQQQLNDMIGSLNELRAVFSQLANETASAFRHSILSTAQPGRLELASRLAELNEHPSSDELENLWQEAMEALEIVPDNSSLRQSGSSYLLLGIAAYHTNDRKRALTRLKQAQQFDATQHQAEWWLGKLDEK